MFDRMMIDARVVAAAAMLWPVLTNVYAQDTPGSRPVPPKPVVDLAGVYRGTWSMYGIDEKGMPVKRMAWTDVMTASNPAVDHGRGFVSTVDEMTFEGGRIPPIKIKGTEGYSVAPDGTLGDYFIEVSGQVHRVIKLGQNTWVYTAPAFPQELAPLGFKDVISAQHTVIKTAIEEDGVETHHISRVTLVNWKDSSGKARWIQYVSLEGVHRRDARAAKE
jgi:hypothetical protein